MLHLPFEDRMEAGRAVADELVRRKLDENAIVLGLARGGVPVAFAVADRLRLPLDVLVARKIGVPWQPELAMGAMAGSVQVLDEAMIRQLGISKEDVESTVAAEMAEMQRREDVYRAGGPALRAAGKIAVLVDDGLATGSTMVAAVRYVRHLHASKIVVAVPVASGHACRRLAIEADTVICLATPEPFFAVGEWYREFDQVSDAEVMHLLEENRQRMKAHEKPSQAA